MAPLGLKVLSNSASVIAGRAFCCTSSVVFMKKNLRRQNYLRQQARQMMLRKNRYDFGQVNDKGPRRFCKPPGALKINLKGS